MDAPYFEQFCMLCYQDHDDGYTQLIRFSDGEHYSEIKEDLDNLIKLGAHIESVTTDGIKLFLKPSKSRFRRSSPTLAGTHSKNVFALADAVSKSFFGSRAAAVGAYVNEN
jgi:hypothetical protein